MNSKYKKGDIVYYGTSAYVDKILPCPDCLGTKEWVVIFADGDNTKVNCQTCCRSWNTSHGTIQVKDWSEVVNKLTIGSIKYDDSDKCPFRYMCEETGIGSGSVYNEDMLHSDRESALEEAKKRTEESVKAMLINNYSGRFRETIEDKLSTFVFTRLQAVEEAKRIKTWLGISGTIKNKRKPTK